MRVSRARLLLLIIGLSGLIFVVLQSTSGERKASASAGESLLDHLRPGRAGPTLEVLPGTNLHVRLTDTITDRNRAGDIFVGKLDGDVEESGKVLIPRGSRVIGRITRLGEDTSRVSATQVSLVLEQMVVGKKVISVDSQTLTLLTPASVPSPGPNNPFVQAPGLFPDPASVQQPSDSETIYEADTRLTFVLAERLRLPVFVPSD
jgi:hypothetical protein